MRMYFDITLYIFSKLALAVALDLDVLFRYDKRCLKPHIVKYKQVVKKFSLPFFDMKIEFHPFLGRTLFLCLYGLLFAWWCSVVC